MSCENLICRGNNNKRDYDRAIADYSEAIRLNPRDALPYRNRALAYEKKGNTARAKADREIADQLDSSIGKK